MRTLDPLKHEQRRNAILDRSRRLFANHGFAETSMAQIGRACRLTKPALYHYFRSKEEILSGIFESHWRQTEDQINNFPRAANLEAMLRDAGAAYLEHWKDPRNVELCKISMQEGAHLDSGKHHGVHWVKPKVDQRIAELFRAYFPPTVKTESVQLFVFSFFGALFHYVFGETFQSGTKGPSVSQKRYLENLVKIFSSAKP